ncbi:cold-responsive protein kinase 1-like [Ipomoea triloba]|uniref:cold-responsive protein kinase 1-like n=1 Tax=Ipomoea triloba TaxID=35885 RepID=UPI00125E2FEE|nr:cold-responsive protein kinase 1-like [Ipomoea triloba]XP_031108002.1 cold-responsive protein kinase 1-like [Ipomoea triloba]
MAGSGRWWWLAVVMLVVSVSEPAFSDPQTEIVDQGCGLYHVSDVPNYNRELNLSFADLRNQLSSANKHFATSTQKTVYAMAQCRKYLSTADCVACFDAAVLVTRNCSNAGVNSAILVFDGCFLRYNNGYFYDQSIDEIIGGTYRVCGNRTASKQNIFNATAAQQLNELLLATPRIHGFYAAAKLQEESPGGATTYAVAQCAETMSESNCKDCLSVAYNNIKDCLPNSADGRAGVDAGCFLRYSDTPFFADNQTTDITPFLGRGNSSGKKKPILAGVVGTVGIILVLAALFLWYLQSRKQNAWIRGNILGTKSYIYKDLKAATNDFSEENILGKGGFGDVYKGTLQSGDVVAVKKLIAISSRAKANFETEISLIANANHPNLIRLLGYSGNGKVLILVYEYMANASLDKYIYGEKRGMLNWKQRVDIILGMARGLEYLHEQFDVCIIHRDIKSSNILLDDEFQPKIADFGLARLLPENKTHLTTKFAGTLGYTAPEYAIHGHLSEKVDIYSFGIVILEIISGRRSSDLKVEPVTEYLLEQAWKLYENDEHLGLVDNNLDPNEYEAEEVKRMLEIALVCTQSPSKIRPSMSEVVVMLSSTDASIIQKPQNRPTTITDFNKRMPTATNTSTLTNATISFSRFSGR